MGAHCTLQNVRRLIRGVSLRLEQTHLLLWCAGATCMFLCMSISCCCSRMFTRRIRLGKLIKKKKILADLNNKLFAVDDGITILNYEIKGFASYSVVFATKIETICVTLQVVFYFCMLRVCWLLWMTMDCIQFYSEWIIFYYRLCSAE